jgi:hypothetical protein
VLVLHALMLGQSPVPPQPQLPPFAPPMHTEPLALPGQLVQAPPFEPQAPVELPP